MEYTVNGLARLAGVSVRTLHWYDEIGLLRPARVTEAGYRMYGPDEVDALQSILFYRALGVPLKQIGALMADASAGRLAALQSHRAALLCRRAQLDALLATLDKTILTEEGKCAMTDAEKFEGFKQKLVAENEAEYGAEARGKYGDTAVDASNAKLMGLSPEQYGEMQKLSARLFPGAGYGTASAHPSASTVETAPAVSACQSSSPPARFSSVPVFQAPRIPI